MCIGFLSRMSASRTLRGGGEWAGAGRRAVQTRDGEEQVEGGSTFGNGKLSWGTRQEQSGLK